MTEASPALEVPVICRPQLRQWQKQTAPVPIFIFLALCGSQPAACRRCLRAFKANQARGKL